MEAAVGPEGRVDRPGKKHLIDKCRELPTQLEVAEWYGVDPKTVRRWLSHYGNPVLWGRGRRRKGHSKLELEQAKTAALTKDKETLVKALQGIQELCLYNPSTLSTYILKRADRALQQVEHKDSDNE
jgi:NADH/NAD ratio-sensing transcriptional regulator Rex